LDKYLSSLGKNLSEEGALCGVVWPSGSCGNGEWR